jgi:hypothetical protein
MGMKNLFVALTIALASMGFFAYGTVAAGQYEWMGPEQEMGSAITTQEQGSEELSPATSSPEQGIEELSPSGFGSEESSAEMAPAGSSSHEKDVTPHNAPYRAPAENQSY